MHFLLNVLTAILLLLGLFSPRFGELLSPQTTVITLLVSAIVLSISIGILWFSAIKREMANGAITNIHKTVDALLKNKNRWLQVVLPVVYASKNDSSSDAKSYMNIIQHRFMSSFLMSIWALGIGTIAVLTFEDARSSRGLFSMLLNSSEGKGLAIAFSLYISISSLAFLTIGFLAFLNRENSK